MLKTPTILFALLISISCTNTVKENTITALQQITKPKQVCEIALPTNYQRQQQDSNSFG
jgi:hypothetical protein